MGLESFKIEKLEYYPYNLESPAEGIYNNSTKLEIIGVESSIDTSNIEFNKLENLDNNESIEVITDKETTEKIATSLESIDKLNFENWTSLSLDERKEVLTYIENQIAIIEHRPPLIVDIELMSPDCMGYQDSSSNRIVINSYYLIQNTSLAHREIIDTIIHEGRHAYQHYNVDVHLIHESGAEVNSWRENFYDPQYGYYHSTGQKIYIPSDKGWQIYPDFRLYYYQPVEIDARNFASDVTSKLEGKNFFG